MPQRKGWWRSPGCIWSFLADGKKKTTFGGGNNFLIPFKFLILDDDVHPKDFPTETLGILYGPTALSKVFNQNGPFPPIWAFLPPTCLARVSRPKIMSSSTETCTYNDAERLMFFFVTCSPHQKKTCSTPLALHCILFFQTHFSHHFQPVTVELSTVWKGR